MMQKHFRLQEHGTTARTEVLCGFTTFLSMMYILFTNSSILSETGMPTQGIFIATALTAVICTFIVSLYANLPFAMAPGMGQNTIFVHTICIGMGYHWKEALAICFLAGLIHFIIMSTRLRKAFVNAIPEHLRVASGAGLGMFIAYVGIKNAGLLTFTSSGGYEQPRDGVIMLDSSAVPSLVELSTSTQVVAFIGFLIMIALTALERRTGDRYMALPAGIIAATFIGIPLGVTRFGEVQHIGISAIESFGQVFLSFFGRPGLLSVFSDPEKIFRAILLVLILNMTDILDSVGTMIGIGQVHGAKLFDLPEMQKFAQKGRGSKLDKALVANSLGSVVSSLSGTSPATIYMESVTGIVSGGRTGLTGLVTGALFLLCLPMAGFFQIIPNAAVAPALIIAGSSMLTRMRHVNWRKFEEGFPAFLIMIFMTVSYSILDGISIGIICHVAIQTAVGKTREIHPVLFVISAVFVIIKISQTLLMG